MKADRKPAYIRTGDLAQAGMQNLPRFLRSSEHLIYSSPATLAFNSPGAEGFGVKRAGLAIPGSVMLIVSPGCCGRNTTLISRIPGYDHRFFYYNLEEKDLVTGAHLEKIPQAAAEIVRSLPQKPSVLMICITCVDALLGTDMERVCRRAQEAAGVPVRPCYMYALTREGSRPPMVHVRQSLYALLEKRPRRSDAVNLLGYFSPLRSDCELYDLLRQVGVRQIREISTCGSYEEFQRMAGAHFNLLLSPEGRFAAKDISDRLGIPYIELARLYDIERIRRQYRALGQALGVSFDDTAFYEDAAAARDALLSGSGSELRIAVGERLNADPFELSCALTAAGLTVSEIYGTVTDENFVWIRALSAVSPDTKVYSNLDPSMMDYDPADSEVNFALGADARYYHPDVPGVDWNSEVQPFGYAGARALYREMAAAMEGAVGAPMAVAVRSNTAAAAVRSNTAAAAAGSNMVAAGSAAGQKSAGSNAAVSPGAAIQETAARSMTAHATVPETFEKDTQRQQASDQNLALPETDEIIRTASAGSAAGKSERRKSLRALRKYLTPFAPDQSGAVAALYDLGGMIVICDAGGCAGNICGFDEPRWEHHKSAIFSAGLRDMDAIMGQDRKLVRKITDAASRLDVKFIALIGTPVPSVIGTDYQALAKMIRKETALPVLCIDTNGMELYDRGEEKAYLALYQEFAGQKDPVVPGSVHVIGEALGAEKLAGAKESVASGKVHVIGETPGADRTDDENTVERIGSAAHAGAFDAGKPAGAEDRLEEIRRVSSAEKIIVSAPCGIAAARYLQRKFGTPYEIVYPGADRLLKGRVCPSECGLDDARAGGKGGSAEKTACVGAGGEESASSGKADTGEDHLRAAASEKASDTRQTDLQWADGRRILIVHQHVLADALRCRLLEAGADRVTVATWFSFAEEVRRTEDVFLKEEDDFTRLAEAGYDVIIADAALKPLASEFKGPWVDLPHFALSGRGDGGA